MEDEHEAIAEELRRVREAVSQEPLPERPAAEVLPPARPTRAPARPTRAPERATREADPAPPPLDLAAPELGPLNDAWDLAGFAPGGRLARLLRRLLAPWLGAQTEFNARQVRFDNRALAWIEARLAHTHRHYDAVLGQHGRHMEEIDQRHLQLQEDLVAHVHDLVQRVDLVLADGERGRVSLEVALRDLRARLQDLETRVARGGRA